MLRTSENAALISGNATTPNAAVPMTIPMWRPTAMSLVLLRKGRAAAIPNKASDAFMAGPHVTIIPIEPKPPSRAAMNAATPFARARRTKNHPRNIWSGELDWDGLSFIRLQA